MKKYAVIKRLSALALALVMAFTMVVPALAEGGEARTSGPYTITIQPNSFTSRPDNDSAFDGPGERYKAFQIFSYHTEPAVDTKDPLSVLDWGSAIRDDVKIALLEALGKNIAGVDENSTASEVASSLNAGGNEAAQQAAKIIGAKGESGYEYLQGEGYISEWYGNDECWRIKVSEPGYYLIRDEYANGNSSSANSMIIMTNVYEDITISLKTEGPKANKSIVVDGTEEKAKDFEIGQTITYKLTGTPSENYYTTNNYKFVFTDNMSKGLTYVGGGAEIEGEPYGLPSKVYISTKGGEEKNLDYSENEYTLSVDHKDEGTTIKVTISDMKKFGADITEVGVVYTAKLNENAVTGAEGNTNSLTLNYGTSDDGSDPEGETTPPDGGTKAYTLGIEITKVSELDEKVTLEGAVFALKNEDGEYASVVGPTDDDGFYYLKEWVTSADDSVKMMTGRDGVLRIKGLVSGTYSLEEIEAPVGFESLENEIVITLELEPGDDGSLNKLAYTINMGDDNVESNTSGDDLVAKIVVANRLSDFLPGTGGMGVYLFYISGSALLIGAAIYLIYSHVKNKKKSVSDT